MHAREYLFTLILLDMRLGALAENTPTSPRRCAIARLGDWLAARCEAEPWPGAPGPVPVEDATAADLLASRTALTISPKSVGPYVDHLRGYYVWLVQSGYRPANPVARLPVSRGHQSLP